MSIETVFMGVGGQQITRKIYQRCLDMIGLAINYHLLKKMLLYKLLSCKFNMEYFL